VSGPGTCQVSGPHACFIPDGHSAGAVQLLPILVLWPGRRGRMLLSCSFTRVGCMILLLHDVCDVLMEAAKMCKYCGQEVRPPASYFPLFGALQIDAFIVQKASAYGLAALLLPRPYHASLAPLAWRVRSCPPMKSTWSARPAKSQDAPVAVQLMSSIIFGLFMLMWMVMRLIYFPIWVIWSTR
jgi:hypothetical protein